MREELEIIQWNCNGLYPKLTRFKNYLYDKKPHIVCLCETILKENREPNFTNYNTFFKHRVEGTKGGQAILVRRDVIGYSKQINYLDRGQLEIQAVTIVLDRDKVDILNIYNPNKNITVNEFEYYINQLENKIILIGDLNAHHPMWEERSQGNATGNNIVNILFKYPDLTLVTPKSLPTRNNLNAFSSSTIDLCFASSELSLESNVKVIDDFGSDHELISITFNVKTNFQNIKTRRKWKFGESPDWANWGKLLDEPIYTGDVINDYNLFVNNIVKTSDAFFGRTSGNFKPKYSKPWWNSDCSKASIDKKKAKRALKHNPSPENLINLKRAEAIVKKTVKEAKKASFKNYCSQINCFTPIGEVWKKVSSFNGKRRFQSTPPLQEGSVLHTQPAEKAEVIANGFEASFNINHDERSENIDSNVVTEALESNDIRGLNTKITLEELKHSLSSLKDTSQGRDGVHNLMLKNLPTNYLTFLLSIINDSVEKSVLPEEWKKAIIVPIHKKGKEPSQPSSYRPISLLSCVSKVVEKIVCKRVNYYLEHNNLLSSNQAGFRKRLSTQEQIGRVETQIKEALANKKVCIVVFFDLTGAYDRVWHMGLLHRLASLGIKGRMLKWIKEYLRGRSFQVFLEGSLSTSRSIGSSVPQGSSFSPTLFNVMIGNIPLQEGVQTTEVADDIAIICSHTDLTSVINNIQDQVNSFSKWCDDWGMVININKTKAMFFTHRQISTPVITLGECNIEFVKEFKFLGIIFDAPRCTWNKHIANLKFSTINSLNLLSNISGRDWGADRETLLLLYRSLIRSKLDYGAVFYSSAATTNLNKLDVIQTSALRIACGARRTSPKVSLEVECNIPPLFIHRKKQLLSYLSKLRELPVNLTMTKQLIHESNSPYNWTWLGAPAKAPSVTRCKILEYDLLGVNHLPNPISLVGPVPPWEDHARYCFTDFSTGPVDSLTDDMARSIFGALREERHAGMLEVYTDGSKVIKDNVTSVTAGMVVFNEEGKMFQRWKLPQEFCIMTAELYAIWKALEFLSTQILYRGVIYSDSLSSISLIKGRDTKRYLPMCFKIQRLLMDMNRMKSVHIQYVPGHKGIEGNELADLAASSAHNLDLLNNVPVPREDILKAASVILIRQWDAHWSEQVQFYGKGRHLKQIKTELGHWPWASHQNRCLEKTFTRLRIGHVGLQQHLFRFNMTEDERCSCLEDEESVEHYLLHCRNFLNRRVILLDELQKIKVQPTTQNLLGGGQFPDHKQKLIINIVGKFINDTKILKNM